MSGYMTVVAADLPKFRKRYQQAVEAKEEQFKFKFINEPEPLAFLTSYAKYLIEYLESRIGG